MIDSAGSILPGLTAGNISIADADGNTYLPEEAQNPPIVYSEIYNSDQQNFDNFDNAGELLSGELGQQNFDNYTIVEEFSGVAGVETNTDLPDYIEDEGGSYILQ
ncbi:MAG: hypothetical protein IJC39_05805 [Firmicutes bacterium]|nr:hypothetical protein [Bacillota bacterium]